MDHIRVDDNLNTLSKTQQQHLVFRQKPDSLQPSKVNIDHVIYDIRLNLVEKIP